MANANTVHSRIKSNFSQEIDSTEMNIAVEKSRPHKYYRIAFALALFTIIYNLGEGILSTYFGYEDESLALFGFGVDSFIEVLSGLGVQNRVEQRFPIEALVTDHRRPFMA